VTSSLFWQILLKWDFDTKYVYQNSVSTAKALKRYTRYKDKLPRYFEDFVRDALAEKYEEEEELMFSRGGCGDNCQR